MTVREVRPVAGPAVYGGRPVRDCRFEVDDAAGELRWFEAAAGGSERAPQVFALPGGRSDRPRLSAVLFARYPSVDRATLGVENTVSKVWFIGADGTLIGRSKTNTATRERFPGDLLEPLTAAGLLVEDKSYDTVWAAKSAFHGAVPAWPMRSRRTIPVAYTLILVVVVAVIVGIVTL